MTDTELVARKLAVLREHLSRLRRRRGEPGAARPRDEDLEDAVGMSLLVAVQEAVDVAFHVAADEGWGAPASYAEGFDVLAQHGVIDAALAASLAGTAQLRNRIAHGYASVDFDRIWTELPAGLAALESYVSALAAHAARVPAKPA